MQLRRELDYYLRGILSTQIWEWESPFNNNNNSFSSSSNYHI